MLEHKVRLLSGKTLKQRQAETGRTLSLNGAAWRALRAMVLREQPLCPRCREHGTLGMATEVDHADNDPTNNERHNLVGLCKSHHSEKTRREMLGLAEPAAVRGCDANGMPLDPDHPWNAEKSPATEKREPLRTPRARRRSS
jgi:5-methylcytosine-specific restriction enzyme A